MTILYVLITVFLILILSYSIRKKCKDNFAFGSPGLSRQIKRKEFPNTQPYRRTGMPFYLSSKNAYLIPKDDFKLLFGKIVSTPHDITSKEHVGKITKERLMYNSQIIIQSTKVNRN